VYCVVERIACALKSLIVSVFLLTLSPPFLKEGSAYYACLTRPSLAGRWPIGHVMPIAAIMLFNMYVYVSIDFSLFSLALAFMRKLDP
jgi:hypothetical protein